MVMSGFAGHIDSWLTIARHEKIDNLEKSNGHHSCNAQLYLNIHGLNIEKQASVPRKYFVV